jgi:hypothetical protein
MVGIITANRRRRRRNSPLLFLFAAALCAALLGVSRADAAQQMLQQFDVFLGYDGIVPEASWFPIVIEVKNDGPTFNALIEVSPGNFNQGQTRRVAVELPTGTLKRLVIPCFSSTRGFSQWDVRLYDERGKVRGEQLGLRPRRQSAMDTPLLGAIPRSPSGVPEIKPILPQAQELQPVGARLLPTLLPDNPLALEGLSCIYLNSEKAADLTVAQVNALESWLHAGGHLIVAVEQPGDVNSTPWLKAMLPCEVKNPQPVNEHPQLDEWLKIKPWPEGAAQGEASAPGPNPRSPRRTATPAVAGVAVDLPFANLPEDTAFNTAPMQVAGAVVHDGRADVAAGDTPLVVTAPRGQGAITVLLFSPEREPARSWKNLPVFWARLAQVPGRWYVFNDYNPQSGWSSDGLFGAMIDTKQVHKLPVGWLLLLLMAYLVVIGPFDQYWLKKIRRPMLTWITFPCYVVGFSLLIYLIGYKLRAGESEWNELHVVDVLQHGAGAELRGRTYSSVYSPSNQRYDLASQQRYALLRGEFAGMWSGGQSSEKATIDQVGDNFKAQLFVPVWTSQLFVCDWWQSAALPLELTVSESGPGWEAKVENHTDQKVTSAQLVIDDYIFRLGDIGPGEAKTFKDLTPPRGRLLKSFVNEQASRFGQAIQSRQHAFGGSDEGQINDLPNATMAISFLSKLGEQRNYMNSFTSPPGLDKSGVVADGNALLMAWADGSSPIPRLHQFSPRRAHKQTLWRMAAPVQKTPAAEAAPQI